MSPSDARRKAASKARRVRALEAPESARPASNSVVNPRLWRCSEVEIEIDPEFASEVPRQTPAELAQLRRSLIAEGCRDPLIVWDGTSTLIDGQHRWPLLQELDIPFKIVRREF